MRKIWLDAQRNVINLDDWDEMMRPREVVAERRTVIGYRELLDDEGKPIPGPDGEPEREPIVVERGEVYVPDPLDLVAANPIPAGTTMIVDDVVARADGGLAAASDHGSLRRVAYPALEEQLDAIWKLLGEAGGEMGARIRDVKALYPKTIAGLDGFAADV